MHDDDRVDDNNKVGNEPTTELALPLSNEVTTYPNHLGRKVIVTQEERQLRGSATPLPGRCNNVLKLTDVTINGVYWPPRYCKNYPRNGRTRCRMCGGNTRVGAGSGRATTLKYSKYTSALPPALRNTLNVVSVDDIVSNRDELELLDARTAQLVESLEGDDPLVLANNASRLVAELNSSIAVADVESVLGLASELAPCLSQLINQANTWKGIRDNLKARNALARTELQYQKMMSDNILVEQLDAFVHAVVARAALLTDDMSKVSQYVVEVKQLAVNIMKGVVDDGDNSTVDDSEDGYTIDVDELNKAVGGGDY